MRLPSLLAALAAAFLLFTSAPAAAQGSSGVAVLDVRGIIAERANPFELFGPTSTPLRRLVDAVDRAAADDEVQAIVVNFDNPLWDLAQAMEFHDALLRFRESGKRSYAVYAHGGLATYVASTGAQEIVLPPLGMLGFSGFSLSLYYVKDLLGKLGVEAEVIQFMEYKDAAEALAASEPSGPAREQMELLLDDLFSVMVDRVAAGRGLDREAAEALLTAGPYSAKAAIDAGVIDRIAYPEDMEDLLGQDLDSAIAMKPEYGRAPRRQMQPPSLMSLFTGGTPRLGGRASAARDQHIAVVYALGMIVDGELDEMDFLFSVPMIADESFNTMLEEAASRDGVQAIVLRISSPGGSASASDRIWNKIEDIRARGIPVVVSMGGVAASGGYYIAMGADHIVAEPVTLTGSIGVVGAKIVLGGTYEMIGVNRHEFSIGDNAGLLDETRRWTDEERAVMEDLLRPMYEEFTRKAAESRGLSEEQIDAVARGRVWSGLSAKEGGLVDELGGLGTAIAKARELADAPDAIIREYPRELGLMELIERLFAGEITAPRLPPGGGSLGPLEPALRTILPEGALALAALFHHQRSVAAAPLPLMINPWLIRTEH